MREEIKYYFVSNFGSLVTIYQGGKENMHFNVSPGVGRGLPIFSHLPFLLQRLGNLGRAIWKFRSKGVRCSARWNW